jgi:hypothetical protein
MELNWCVDGRIVNVTLTVELANGSTVTYDPRRLRGVHVFRETEREFATAGWPQPAERSPDLHYYLAKWPTVQMIQSIGKIAEIVDRVDDRFDPVLFQEIQKISHVLP